MGFQRPLATVQRFNKDIHDHLAISSCQKTFFLILPILASGHFVDHCSCIRSLYLSSDSAVHRRGGGVILFPFLRRLALGGPGMDDGNLILESGVHDAVALERVETAELVRDDEGCESLTAAALKE